MKNKKWHNIILILALVLLLFELKYCTERPHATQQEIEQLMLTPDEAKRFTPEMLEHRKASLVLSEYVVLKEQQYVLEISAKEAMEKEGISQELYDKVVKDLEDTNAAITKALQEGQKLHLPKSFADFK